MLLWQVELFGYHKQYSITFVVCASLQHVCGLGIWLIQQVIVLLLFYNIHCQHYGLLTSWWRSCSNFRNEKSRLRGVPDKNSNWELKNSVNTFCLPFRSLCFFCLSMLCLCFLCYVISASFSFLFQIP